LALVQAIASGHLEREKKQEGYEIKVNKKTWISNLKKNK